MVIFWEIYINIHWRNLILSHFKTAGVKHRLAKASMAIVVDTGQRFNRQRFMNIISTRRWEFERLKYVFALCDPVTLTF